MTSIYNFNGRKGDFDDAKYIMANGKKLTAFKGIDVNYFTKDKVTYVASVNGEEFFYSVITDSPFPTNSIIQQVVLRKGATLSGITYHLIFDVYLKKYQYVLSDGFHYPDGDTLWVNIRKYSLDNGFEIGIVNIDSHEMTQYDKSAGVEEWFSQFKKDQDENFRKFRYYVKRK